LGEKREEEVEGREKGKAFLSLLSVNFPSLISQCLSVLINLAGVGLLAGNQSSY
jgi:hypothetical protein